MQSFGFKAAVNCRCDHLKWGDGWQSGLVRNDEPIRIGASLHDVVNALRPDGTPGGVTATGGDASASALGGVFGRWEEAVGDALAAHVQPVKLDGSTLVVQVDDPAWATQLKFLEATLKQRLAEIAGATIDRIEVRVAR